MLPGPGGFAFRVLVWVVVQGMGAEPWLSRSVCELGLIPGEFLGRLPEGYTLPIVLVLLVVVFGSVTAASLPLAVGVLAILGGFFLVRTLALVTEPVVAPAQQVAAEEIDRARSARDVVHAAVHQMPAHEQAEQIR